MGFATTDIRSCGNGYIATYNGRSYWFDSWADAVVWLEKESKKEGNK